MRGSIWSLRAEVLWKTLQILVALGGPHRCRYQHCDRWVGGVHAPGKAYCMLGNSTHSPATSHSQSTNAVGKLSSGQNPAIAHSSPRQLTWLPFVALEACPPPQRPVSHWRLLALGSATLLFVGHLAQNVFCLQHVKIQGFLKVLRVFHLFHEALPDCPPLSIQLASSPLLCAISPCLQLFLLYSSCVPNTELFKGKCYLFHIIWVLHSSVDL